MAFKEITCRYCGEPFRLMPGKPGYANECPDCLQERAELAKGAPKTALQKFMELVAEYPPTVRTTDGRLMISATRIDLVGKLRRLTNRYGSRLSDETIQKISDAYIAVVQRSEQARGSSDANEL